MSILRVLAVAFIFVVASVAWVALGGVTMSRSGAQSSKMRGAVAELWGRPQAQAAPSLTFEWTTSRTVRRTETYGNTSRVIEERVDEKQTREATLTSSDVAVDLRLDQRRKGLVWLSLYDVAYRARHRYTHPGPEAGALRVGFRFPDAQGVYDDFQLTLDGKTQDLRPKNGELVLTTPVAPGQTIELGVAYRSRGEGEWKYVPDPGVASLHDFRLTMTTDFADIDFPAMTMSPSARRRVGTGHELEWRFAHVVTGHAIGMTMPKRIQPGELSSALSFSAPVSLLFFFLVMMVLSSVKRAPMHPVNYLFLAGAFFAFHLLFAYAVDHVTVAWAFAASSAVSVLLVTTYLRLVVSTRFAFVEAGASMLVYLVGFSLAHFWEGFTGLTITVLAIVTLFLMMQLTGRIRWGASDVPATAGRREEGGRMAPT